MNLSMALLQKKLNNFSCYRLLLNISVIFCFRFCNITTASSGGSIKLCFNVCREIILMCATI